MNSPKKRQAMQDINESFENHNPGFAFKKTGDQAADNQPDVKVRALMI
jgi:hypothetical protein